MKAKPNKFKPRAEECGEKSQLTEETVACTTAGSSPSPLNGERAGVKGEAVRCRLGVEARERSIEQYLHDLQQLPQLPVSESAVDRLLCALSQAVKDHGRLLLEKQEEHAEIMKRANALRARIADKLRQRLATKRSS